MDVMEVLGTFGSRDIALIFWCVVILIAILLSAKMRVSLLDMLKAFNEKIILIIFSAMTVYVMLIIMLLYRLDIWKITLLKDTIFWFLGTACVLLINVNKATKDETYFKNIVRDAIKVSLLLGFVINFYTFDLWVEIILVPVLVLLVGISAIAGMRPDAKAAKNWPTIY